MFRRIEKTIASFPKAEEEIDSLIVPATFHRQKAGTLRTIAVEIENRFGVDIHVHRVTNRWGYVAAKTPEKTMAALERKLPEKFWIDINRLLVPFGKNICTGNRPKCSTCPVLEMCRQVGVVNPR